MGVEEGYTIGGYYNSSKTIETALIPLLQQVYNGEDMGIRTVHVEPCLSLVVFGQCAGMVFYVDRL